MNEKSCPNVGVHADLFVLHFGFEINVGSIFMKGFKCKGSFDRYFIGDNDDKEGDHLPTIKSKWLWLH